MMLLLFQVLYPVMHCTCLFVLVKGFRVCVYLIGILNSWCFIPGEEEYYTEDGIAETFEEPWLR